MNATDPFHSTRQASSDAPIAGDLVGLRRRLHAIPEVGLQLPQTQHALQAELEDLPVELRRGDGLSSLTAIIRGRWPGPTVLLRADMDALPIHELAPVEYASVNGAMHACGHDLHMAALVGAVRHLCAKRDQLAGTVIAMFQPGEEGHGGARAMIDEGILVASGEVPIASYGVHVFSFLDSGVFSCRGGVVMGGTMNLNLEIRGIGGHAARPEAARNPILVASLVVQAIQTYVTQTTSLADPVIATVGSFQSGDAANAIPDDARLGVSIRAITATRVREVGDRIIALTQSIASGYGMTIEATTGPLLPPTISRIEDADLVRDTVSELFGPERFRELAQPEMIAEDFSEILDATGGAFVFVGARGNINEPAPNHSPRAVFDDAVILDTARMLAELAVRRLAHVQVMA